MTNICVDEQENFDGYFQSEHLTINSDNDSGSPEGSIPHSSYFSQEFVPRDTDVIIGKGLRSFSHVGNEVLRSIITSRLTEYNSTEVKRTRSNIISSIIMEIKITYRGSFVKKDIKTGLWFEADEVLARDKISHAIRRISQRKNDNKSNNEYKENDFISSSIPHFIPQRLTEEEFRTCCNLKTTATESSKLTRMSWAAVDSIDIVEKLYFFLPNDYFNDSKPYEPVPVSEALYNHHT